MSDLKPDGGFGCDEEVRGFWEGAKIFEIDENGEEVEMGVEELRERVG